MPDHRGVLREVAWHDIFPWLLLLRTIRLALDFRKLLLAALGIVLTAVGWWLIGWVYAQAEGGASPRVSSYLPSQSPTALPPPLTDARDLGNVPPVGGPSLLYVPWREARRAFEVNWLWLTNPFRALFSRDLTWPVVTVALVSALWGLAVWAFFGGAITRIAAIELALEERLGLRSALAHAARKWRAYVAGPLLPLALVFLAALLPMVLGLLLRFDVGVFLAGLLWPLALVCGVVMALAVVGLLLGWPLMWATISVDATDSYDAFGRSYSYVYQRPLQYLFYAIISLVLGVLGWLLMSTFAALVLNLTSWAVSWGSGLEALANVESTTAVDSIAAAGAWLIRFWTACVRLLVLAFGYSFFWTASTAMYLLLRRDADAKETDEVFVEDERDDSGLPPLKTDARGVPVLADDEVAAAPSAEPGSVPGGMSGSSREEPPPPSFD